MAKPDYLPKNLNHPKERWYKCTLCTHVYPENDLIIDKDIGLICKNCAVSKKELDDEQEEIETMRREERKMKAGLLDKEGP